MNDADLVIIDGLRLEGGMEKVVDETKNKNSQLQLLKLGDNTITENQWIYDFSFPKEKGNANPNLWLNVVYAMNFANLTKDRLIEIDAKNADYYTINADRYISLLKKLDEVSCRQYKQFPHKIGSTTCHDSWAYFIPDME